MRLTHENVRTLKRLARECVPAVRLYIHSDEIQSTVTELDPLAPIGLEISQLRFAVPDRIALGGGWSQSRLRRAATISLQPAEARGKTKPYSHKCTRKPVPGRMPRPWFNAESSAHPCNLLKIPRSVAEVNGKASQARPPSPLALSRQRNRAHSETWQTRRSYLNHQRFGRNARPLTLGQTAQSTASPARILP
jgi:hypothetical protein